MRPARFEYVRAGSMNEALVLLSKYGSDAKILAGGQTLVPLLKLRLLEPPKYLIDISRIKEARYIKQAEGEVKIGALTTHHDLEVSAIILQHCPSLSDAAFVLGDPLVRNRGTIGGALSHYDPAADYPAVVVSLNAILTLRNKRAERTINAADFFLDYFTTDLRQDEMLSQVSLPTLGPRQGSAYVKLERVTGDFAVVGAAAFVELGENDTISKVNVALSAVGEKPIVPNEMIKKLTGKKFEDGIVRDAAEEVKGTISPPSDIRASSDYRKDMAAVFAARAVIDAARRAGQQEPKFVAQYQSLRAA